MGGLAAVLPALVLRVAAVRRRVVRAVAPVLLPAVPAVLCVPVVATVAVAAVLAAVVLSAVVVLHVRRAHRHRVHARLLHLHACRSEDLDVARAHDLVSACIRTYVSTQRAHVREHAATTQRGACHVD